MENIAHVNYTRYAHWFSVIILKCVINNSFFACRRRSIFHAPVLPLRVTPCHRRWRAAHFITASNFCADTYLFVFLWAADSVRVCDSPPTRWPRYSPFISFFFVCFLSVLCINCLKRLLRVPLPCTWSSGRGFGEGKTPCLLGKLFLPAAAHWSAACPPPAAALGSDPVQVLLFLFTCSLIHCNSGSTCMCNDRVPQKISLQIHGMCHIVIRCVIGFINLTFKGPNMIYRQGQRSGSW